MSFSEKMSERVTIEKRKQVKNIQMGRWCVLCEKCGKCDCMDEDVCLIAIENYTSKRMCQSCRNHHMDQRPSEDFEFDCTFVATKGHQVVQNLDFYDLKAFILGGENGEGDVVYEPHIDWDFSDSDEQFTYKGSETIEAAAANLKSLEEACTLDYWENNKNEDNTIYTPKQTWLEDEYSEVCAELEQIQKKKRKLEELLK